MFFPTVTVFRGTMLIPIYVDLQLKGEQTGVYTGSFMLPTGSWQLIWTLITLGLSPTDGTVVFSPGKEGVAIEHRIPAPEIKLGRSWPVSSTQWALEVANDVSALGGVLSYNLNLDLVTPDSQTALELRFSHDPSIFVSKDPLELP